MYHHFRTLRVINDDRIAPLGGFPSHPHRDMEIVTHVLSGELEHKDSLGNGEVIRAGEWQRMTAGTGVIHSEFNPSGVHSTHLLQIWIMPERKGLTPGYEQKAFPADRGRWQVVASRDGREGSLTIHQDATILNAHLEKGQTVRYELAGGRGGWLHVATGNVTANGLTLKAGDGLAIEREPGLAVTGLDDTEVLLFDLA